MKEIWDTYWNTKQPLRSKEKFLPLRSLNKKCLEQQYPLINWWPAHGLLSRRWRLAFQESWGKIIKLQIYNEFWHWYFYIWGLKEKPKEGKKRFIQILCRLIQVFFAELKSSIPLRLKKNFSVQKMWAFCRARNCVLLIFFFLRLLLWW